MIIVKTVYTYTLNTALGTCYLATYTLNFVDYACFGHFATESSCTFFLLFAHVLVLAQLLSILLKRILYFFAFVCAYAGFVIFDQLFFTVKVFLMPRNCPSKFNRSLFIVKQMF